LRIHGELAHTGFQMNPVSLYSLIGGTFGLVWWVAGCTAAPASRRVLWLSVGAAIFCGLFALALRNPGPSVAFGVFNGARYGIACTAEAVAIIVAIIVLKRTGAAARIPPVVSAIVGLHFIGLWWALPMPVFLFDAAGLVLAGAVIAIMPIPDGTANGRRLLLTGLTSAAVLWASSLYSLLE
jgi:hypothetical protein